MAQGRRLREIQGFADRQEVADLVHFHSCDPRHTSAMFHAHGLSRGRETTCASSNFAPN